MDEDKIQLFEDKRIRTAWDEEAEEWYFSVVDVVGVLTDQSTARNASTYWAVLKKRLSEEGAAELLTNCKQLKQGAATDPFGLMAAANVAAAKSPSLMAASLSVARFASVVNSAPICGSASVMAPMVAALVPFA